MSKNLKKLQQCFANQFPNFKSTKDGDAIEFTAQDANYRVYLPTGTINQDGSVNLEIKVDHIRGAGATDDHATITVSCDSNGVYLVPPTIDSTWGNEPISTAVKWVGFGGAAIIGVVGTAASIAAGVFTVVGGVVTAVVATGIGLAWAGATEGISVLAESLDKLTDDGGRAYFADIIAHTLVRTNTAIIEYNHPDEPNPRTMSFSFKKFVDAISANGGHSSDKDGHAVKYHHDKKYYRTWAQDYSVSYGNSAMIVSCKVDGIRDDHQDDHLTIMAGFDATGKLISANCTITMENEEALTMPTAITYNSDGQVTQYIPANNTTVILPQTNIIDALRATVDSLLKSNPHYHNFSDQRKYLPQISQMNLQWMEGGVKIS